MREYPEDAENSVHTHELSVSMGTKFDILECSCGWKRVQPVGDTKYAYESWDAHRKQAASGTLSQISSASSSSELHPSEREPDRPSTP